MRIMPYGWTMKAPIARDIGQLVRNRSRSVSGKRWALMTEGPEPDFADVVDRLEPCDLIVVEGYKSQPIAKIEARRKDSHPGAEMAERDDKVVAIAADYAIDDATVPVFELDDVGAHRGFRRRGVWGCG